ncbi:hypothetical protein [Actinophytocola sp.]|uniref:hypothetical protein n=1 Tax=Actinophytocola sp. TaxID=1872138 RepID=UPI002ED8F1AA
MNHRHPALAAADESLLHQTPWPMRHASSSDVRFFDRYWLSCADPAGAAGLIAGVAFYKNTGSCDGYVAIQQGDHQHNVRFARALDDDVDGLRVGDLEVRVVEPFERIELSLRPVASPLAAELEWTSTTAPHLEAHHFDAPAGRVVQDMTRYDQLGRWNGWLDHGSGRVEVRDWWGARDHSWGLRPGVGGFERSHGDPTTGTQLPTAPRAAMLHLVLFGEFDGRFLVLQYREAADGSRLVLDGELVEPTGVRIPVTDVTAQVDFAPDSRAYTQVRLDVRLATDATLAVRAEPLLHAWAYAGTGYDGGFDDRRGLGAWRGEAAEHDVYRFLPPEGVRSGGVDVPPGHREQPVLLTVDGRPGIGHLPVITRGALPRHGLS